MADDEAVLAQLDAVLERDEGHDGGCTRYIRGVLDYITQNSERQTIDEMVVYVENKCSNSTLDRQLLKNISRTLSRHHAQRRD